MYNSSWLMTETPMAIESVFLEQADSPEELYALEAEVDAFIDEVVDYQTSLIHVTDDYAMEGTNIDALKTIRSGLKDMKQVKNQMKKMARKKQWRQAATLAKYIASKYGGMKQQINQLPQSTASAAIIGIGTTLFMLAFSALISKGVSTAMNKVKPFNKARNTVVGKLNDRDFKHLDKAAKFGKKAGISRIDRMADKQVKDQAKKMAGQATGKLKRLTKAGRDAYKTGLKDATSEIIKSGGREAIKADIRAGAAAKNLRAVNTVTDLAVGSFADSMLGKFMKKKGWESASDAGDEPMGPNDFNSLLNMLRKICDDGKKKYLEKAKEYEAKAGGGATTKGATEAWLL